MPNTQDFPIGTDYFNYIIRHLYEDGLIENINSVRTPYGEILDLSLNAGTQITPKGIEYLQNNGCIRKVIKMVPMAAAIADLFV